MKLGFALVLSSVSVVFGLVGCGSEADLPQIEEQFLAADELYGAPSSGPVTTHTHVPGATSGIVLPTATTRPSYTTEIEAVIVIDTYSGTHASTNGVHEFATGHITIVNAVGNQAKVDSLRVDLAMNVSSAKDPAGLPHEVVLQRGDTIEVEGEYIPSKNNSKHNGDGVIHFTHAPLGYVILPDGTQDS